MADNTSTEAAKGGAIGRIVRIVGAVVDVEFPADAMPAIYNALHQLHDDGCGDVGHDAQRKYREVRKRAAGEQVQHGHGHARILERVSELAERDARNRHVGTESIERKDAQREQDLLAQLGNLERVDDRA